MAEYTVEDTSLSAIADKIREKTGSTDALVFPDVFESAIGAIETGVDTSDATAVPSDILSGKTAYVNGEKVTGTMIPAHFATGTVTPSSSKLSVSGLGFAPQNYVVSINESASNARGVVSASYINNTQSAFAITGSNGFHSDVSSYAGSSFSDDGFTIDFSGYSLETKQFLWVAWS